MRRAIDVTQVSVEDSRVSAVLYFISNSGYLAHGCHFVQNSTLPPQFPIPDAEMDAFMDAAFTPAERAAIEFTAPRTVPLWSSPASSSGPAVQVSAKVWSGVIRNNHQTSTPQFPRSSTVPPASPAMQASADNLSRAACGCDPTSTVSRCPNSPAERAAIKVATPRTVALWSSTVPPASSFRPAMQASSENSSRAACDGHPTSTMPQFPISPAEIDALMDRCFTPAERAAIEVTTQRTVASWSSAVLALSKMRLE